MKTSFILSISLLLLSSLASGQDYRLKYIDSEIKKNSSFPEIQTINSLKDSKFFVKRYIEYPTLRDTGSFILNPDGKFQYYPKVRHYHNFQIAELFPGSLKYYKKNRSLIKNPYTVYFIVKPDSISKYFLIIKDPTRFNE